MRAHGGKAVVEAEREKSAHLFKRAGLDHDPWDTVLFREGAQIADECEARLAEITSRLRQEFDLAQ